MPMTELELAIKRFTVYLRDVIEPAVYSHNAPLDISAHLIADPRAPLPTPAEALQRPFTPVSIGWRWGPKWATCWFRVQGHIPDSMRAHPIGLRFSCATEALLWRSTPDGFEPWQGFDVNRDFAFLFDDPARPIDLLIEAACNHPFGVTGFEWDDVEVHRRWNSPTPGHLERGELAMIDPFAWHLRHTYAFALGLLRELPESSPRAKELADALRHATNAIPPGSSAPRAFQEAARILNEALAHNPGRSLTRAHAVGHAHLDTAWLWPLRETKRKCLRTFSNQLRLLDLHGPYTFLCSQAQHYAWIEESSPALFRQITARVAEGRWEPEGGMWVEPDANVPSGESLVRQILHASRYWRSRFAERGVQSILYLPDTFGFPASIPQIMRLAGLSTFITNKLHWNTTNVFPHTTFLWRGIDGSEVLAHNTPGGDYNAANTPKELRRAEENHREKPAANNDVASHDGASTKSPPSPARFLQPFGYGDGGGGPTGESIFRARLASACDGVPRVELSSARAFVAAIHQDRERLRAESRDFARIAGELYLEIHRGTLTTQAWIKRANRRAEEALRWAEILLAGAPAAPTLATVAAINDERDRLDAAWKLLLLNQFHDILPGSSITWVYEDARRQFDELFATTSSLIDRGQSAWASALATTVLQRPIAIFNPNSTPRAGVIPLDPSLGGGFVRVPEIPALGVRVIDAEDPASRSLAHRAPATVSQGVLSNGLLRAAIDPAGRVSSLRVLHNTAEGPELAGADEQGRPAPLNQLVLYEDRPHMWDAWDIDESYLDKPAPVDAPAESIRVIDESPWRVSLRVERPLGERSRITQTYSLLAGSPRLDVHTHVDWRERHTLLRALFSTAIRAPHATYEIQFGHLARPTAFDTPRERAMFEVCAHRWADLSQPGLGLAILNDGKYGHSCRGSTLGLSLLRSPTHPDPEADQGPHEFTYSLMPHAGDWRTAGVDREAEALNTPLRAIAMPPASSASASSTNSARTSDAWSPFSIDCLGGAHVAVAALKFAEEDSRLILRVHESHGREGEVRVRWNIPISRVMAVNLLEEPRPEDQITHDGLETRFRIRPFQVITLAAERT